MPAEERGQVAKESGASSGRVGSKQHVLGDRWAKRAEADSPRRQRDKCSRHEGERSQIFQAREGECARAAGRGGPWVWAGCT